MIYFQIFTTFRYKSLKNSDNHISPGTIHQKSKNQKYQETKQCAEINLIQLRTDIFG